MNTNPDSTECLELYRLFGAAMGGSISEGDLEKLQSVLKREPAARELWFEYNDVECGLGELRPLESGVSFGGVELPVAEEVKRGVVALGWKWGAVAAALVLGCGAGVKGWLDTRGGLGGVAEIVAEREVLWGSPEEVHLVGERVAGGQVLELLSGSVDLRFSSGAKVTLDGPCIFEVVSGNRGRLKFGKAVLDSGKAALEGGGLSLETPGATVQDTHSAFVAKAEADGKSTLEAVRGELEVSVHGRAFPLVLTEGSLVAVERSGPVIQVEGAEGVRDFQFASIEPPSELPVGELGGGGDRVRLLDGHGEAGGVPLSEGDSEGGAREVSLVKRDSVAGRFLVDLGQAVLVTKVNTYSWRGAVTGGGGMEGQRYALYGFNGERVPSMEGTLEDLGWDLIGRVEPPVAGARGAEQQVSSISGGLGRYRYLLWAVEGGGTYGALDVYAAR